MANMPPNRGNDTGNDRFKNDTLKQAGGNADNDASSPGENKRGDQGSPKNSGGAGSSPNRDSDESDRA